MAIPPLAQAGGRSRREDASIRGPGVRYPCTFCQIVSGETKAEIIYEDDEVMVFRNRLDWVPVMLLVVPKRHVTQEELWRDMGRVGEIAVRMGQEHCPHGFRLVSNFGLEALQSQEHGHVHVLGGTFLGEYA
jgi:histidine triad (HIT) family protein